MILGKALILKGLAGVTALSGGVGFYIIGHKNDWWKSQDSQLTPEEIKTALGLPSDCSLPEESSSSGTTCSINTTNINTIKFDGENSTTSITGTATLTITKLTTTDPEFPFDYKFGFKASSSESTILTINSKAITLKQNEDTEFRIKKDSTNNTISLAQVWSLENLAKKVNLSCTNDTCTQISGQTTNIKKDSGLDGKTLTTSGSDSGKIKVYTTETTDYNKDFRFVIEGGDISITNGDSNKLEEFETYEIKKESNKWYFSRKDKAEKGIKKALGLDGIENCNLPEGTTTQECCDLDSEKIKKINFDGKSTSSDPSISDSGTAKLKISKTTSNTSSDFPLGFRFALESEKEITIPLSSGSSSMSLKKKTNTEFKIKATTPSNATARTLTLEKAWTAKTLGEKVGLNCQEPSSDKKCSFNDNSINVNNGNNGNSNTKIDGAKLKNSSESTDKKMSYLEDQEGYNQGIKFTVDGNAAIELTKGEDNSTTLSIENNGTTYEIKQDSNDNKWYLTKYTASN